MTTINLKDFYAWYTHDEYIEVSDEVVLASARKTTGGSTEIAN